MLQSNFRMRKNIQQALPQKLYFEKIVIPKIP